MVLSVFRSMSNISPGTLLRLIDQQAPETSLSHFQRDGHNFTTLAKVLEYYAIPAS